MKDSVKLVVAAVLLMGAAMVLFTVMRGRDAGDQAYYYDLSEQKLYVADTGRIPPLAGVGGESGDGVLAVVYVCGESTRKADRQIAYLMTYSPELAKLKAQAEDATKGKAEYPQQLQDRTWVSANTLVRKQDDTEWHAMDSQAGQDAMAVLNAPCEGGGFPRVCSPAD